MGRKKSRGLAEVKKAVADHKKIMAIIENRKNPEKVRSILDGMKDMSEMFLEGFEDLRGELDHRIIKIVLGE